MTTCLWGLTTLKCTSPFWRTIGTVTVMVWPKLRTSFKVLHVYEVWSKSTLKSSTSSSVKNWLERLLRWLVPNWGTSFNILHVYEVWLRRNAPVPFEGPLEWFTVMVWSKLRHIIQGTTCLWGLIKIYVEVFYPGVGKGRLDLLTVMVYSKLRDIIQCTICLWGLSKSTLKSEELLGWLCSNESRILIEDVYYMSIRFE